MKGQQSIGARMRRTLRIRLNSFFVQIYVGSFQHVFLHACQFTRIKAECLSVEKKFYQGVLDKERFTKGFSTKSFFQGIIDKECFTKGFLRKSVLSRDSRQRVFPRDSGQRIFYHWILTRIVLPMDFPQECFTKVFWNAVIGRWGVPNSLLEGTTMHSGEGLCINKTQLCASAQAYKCA